MKEKISIVFIVFLAVLCLFGCADNELSPDDMVYSSETDLIVAMK